MRARIRAMTMHVPTQVVHGITGHESRVVTGQVEIDLKVFAAEAGELSRMEAGAEIILAPIPVRRTDKITEGTLATWANEATRRDGSDDFDLANAAVYLLPEVVALRREAEALRREVKERRDRDARPLVDKLKEVAGQLNMVIEVKDGVFTMSPRPPDPYEYDD